MRFLLFARVSRWFVLIIQANICPCTAVAAYRTLICQTLVNAKRHCRHSVGITTFHTNTRSTINLFALVLVPKESLTKLENDARTKCAFYF